MEGLFYAAVGLTGAGGNRAVEAVFPGNDRAKSWRADQLRILRRSKIRSAVDVT